MKIATKKQKAYFEKLVEYGCVICRRPAQIHHCGTHLGGGRDHDKVIPLCIHHHTGGGYSEAIHAGKKAFEDKFGTEQELIDKIKSCLGVNKSHDRK